MIFNPKNLALLICHLASFVSFSQTKSLSKLINNSIKRTSEFVYLDYSLKEKYLFSRDTYTHRIKSINFSDTPSKFIGTIQDYSLNTKLNTYYYFDSGILMTSDYSKSRVFLSKKERNNVKKFLFVNNRDKLLGYTESDIEKINSINYNGQRIFTITFKPVTDSIIPIQIYHIDLKTNYLVKFLSLYYWNNDYQIHEYTLNVKQCKRLNQLEQLIKNGGNSIFIGSISDTCKIMPQKNEKQIETTIDSVLQSSIFNMKFSYIKDSSIWANILFGNHIKIIEFSYASCSPCIKSLPKITEFQTKYPDRNYQIYILNPYDTSKSKMNIFNTILENKKVTVPVLYAKIPNLAKWGVLGMPSLVMIDEKGKVIDRFYNFDDPYLNTYIQNLTIK